MRRRSQSARVGDGAGTRDAAPRTDRLRGFLGLCRNRRPRLRDAVRILRKRPRDRFEFGQRFRRAGEVHHVLELVHDGPADLPPHVVHRAPGMELWIGFFADPEGNMLAVMSEVAA